MYRTIVALTVLSLHITSCMEKESLSQMKTYKEVIQVDYPKTHLDTSVVEDYHGTKVADPYRWLEDDNSEETASWVSEQNEVTQSYLKKIPFREDVEKRLTKLWDYEKFGTPFKEAGKYYYYKNDGLQNHYVLYRQVEDGDDEVIIDPNTFSEDGTTSLAGLSFNKDGKYAAYMISEGGSDWRKAYVLDLETKKLLDDELEWIKFSGISWAGDGFFYSRYPVSEDGGELSDQNEYHSLYYHKLGEDQSKDQLIYQNPDHPLRNVYGGTTEDENWLIINESESTSGNSVSIKSLNNPNAQIMRVVDGFDADYGYVDNDDQRMLFKTNDGAPNEKIVSLDLSNPSGGMTEFLAEGEDVMERTVVLGGKLFVEYLHNASSKIKIFDMFGKYQSDFDLPGIGTVGALSGKKKDKEAFFSFSSYTRPGTIYSFDTEAMDYEIFQEAAIDFDSDDYVTEQVWYTSYDGTKVSMFVTHKKGLEKDGARPTLLYGYGGFNISLTPGFSLSRLPILENGGIYAVANLRGGGEYGKEWHKAGTKERKQNVFDDFQAAAEFLIKEGYTSSEKLAIQGGSNGGLLVGACMTQRPDLYAVALPAVGVLDMLRYHEFTIGWAWAEDYGLSSDPEGFEYLMKYSPLHNVKEGVEYPATMVTTADHDDRVVPAHSFKFASELQSKHQGDNPVLIRIETSAGHGAGKPTEKFIEEYADIMSFMFFNMGEELYKDLRG